MYTLYVGADIAAETVALHWQHPQTGKETSVEIKQRRCDYQKVSKRLQKLAAPEQILIVMEATGNYWLALAFFLHAAGFCVSVINPARGRHFARMQLKRAKTDAIDAQLLCQFAQMVSPELWTPPPTICHQLQQRLSLRDDFVKTRTQHRNRLHALRHNPHAERTLVRRLEKQIKSLDKEIVQLTQEITDLLKGDHSWASAAQRLLSIPGIGIINAAWLLCATHAFARCETPAQAAAFAGLAPHASESGKRRGKRKTGGGHADLRKNLYMAAGSALQHNPPLRALYKRHLKRGKIKNVARVAVARKLVHIAWACVVKERDFDPNFRQLPKIAA
jgi:transposase